MKDKNILITGAGSGIGKATARAFAEKGAQVLLVGRREALLTQTAQECARLGGRAMTRTVDLEDGEAAAALGTWALDHMGHIDVLVNNAGHSTKVRSLRYVDPQEFSSVFHINVDAIYRLTQSLLDSMIERRSGSVITISSMAALKPGLLGGVPYGAAKAASFNLMQGLSAEVRNYGIRATTIFPAEVNTPILDNRPLPPDQHARDTMMLAEDIASAVLWCASLPPRVLVEQVVMSPTQTRDVSTELAAAAQTPPVSKT